MYNKAPYIERMVKSISEQTYLTRTKIFVVNDCSTDGSFEILRESADRYQVPMTVFFNEKNMGMDYTVRRLYRYVDTEYFAVLDPDDYYISSERWEKAIQFLNQNPSYYVHFCNYVCVSKDGTVGKAVISHPNRTFNNYSESISTPIPTSMAVFRNFFTKKFLDSAEQYAGNARLSFVSEDDFRNVCAFHYGKGYFDNFIGVGFQEGGLWSSGTGVDSGIMACKIFYDLSLFSKNVLKDNLSFTTCLKMACDYYMNAVNSLCNRLRNLTGSDWKNSSHCADLFGVGNQKLSWAVDILLQQQNDLKSAGLQVAYA